MPVSFSSLRDRQSEGLHEGLRSVVDGLEGAGHRCGDRGGEEDAALVALDHVGDYQLAKVNGRAHVQLDQVQLVGQVGFGGERTACTDAGIEREDVDRAASVLDVAIELDHPSLGGEVDAVSLHLGAGRFQTLLGGGQLRVLGRDQEVEAFFTEDPCQLEADAAGGPGDHRELLIVFSCHRSSFRCSFS
jgi:hypothetical protein